MTDLAHSAFVNPLVTFVNDQLACLLLVVAINSLENITCFKLEKQNIQASHTIVIHVSGTKPQHWRGWGKLGQDNKGNYQYKIMSSLFFLSLLSNMAILYHVND